MKRCLSCESRFATESWECPACHATPETDGGLPVFAPALAREIAGYETALFDTHGGDQAERSFWTGEFKIGPLNDLFKTVMTAERWTIRQGMRWPFGGSLLLVARKLGSGNDAHAS